MWITYVNIKYNQELKVQWPQINFLTEWTWQCNLKFEMCEGMTRILFQLFN